MMRKFLTILLAVAMVLTLAACGGKDNAANNNGQNEAGTSQNQTGNAGGQQQENSQPKPESGEGQKEETPAPETGKEEVKPENQPEQVNVTISHTDVTLFEEGESFRLGIRGISGVYAATFTSADETIAAVDQNGVVSAVAPGTTVVSVHIEGNGGQYDMECIVRCDWKEEEEPADGDQPDNSQPDQTLPSEGVDLEAFYSQITGSYEFGPLERIDGEILENYYAGMSAVETKQQLVTFNMMTMNNGEFCLAEVANAADVETVKAIFQARVDYMVDGGAFYPGATDQWEFNSRVVAKGNCVMMIVHENCDDIVAAFNSFVG